MHVYIHKSLTTDHRMKRPLQSYFRSKRWEGVGRSYEVVSNPEERKNIEIDKINKNAEIEVRYFILLTS